MAKISPTVDDPGEAERGERDSDGMTWPRARETAIRTVSRQRRSTGLRGEAEEE